MWWNSNFSNVEFECGIRTFVTAIAFARGAGGKISSSQNPSRPRVGNLRPAGKCYAAPGLTPESLPSLLATFYLKAYSSFGLPVYIS